MRANTQCIARGHETRGAGVGRTKQWGTETLGDLWKGEGWGREHGEYKMDIIGTFRKESREFDGRWVWGGLTGVEKIEVLDGGR